MTEAPPTPREIMTGGIVVNAPSLETESGQTPREDELESRPNSDDDRSLDSARKVTKDLEIAGHEWQHESGQPATYATTTTTTTSINDGMTSSKSTNAMVESRCVLHPMDGPTTAPVLMAGARPLAPSPAHSSPPPPNPTVQATTATHAFTTAPQPVPSYVPQTQQPLLAPMPAAGRGQASTNSSAGVAATAPLAVVSNASTETPLMTFAAPSSATAGSSNIKATTTTPAGQGKVKPGSTLRRGKWTVEEEAYVARVIQDFNSGFLNAPAGTTLRTYLSDKLQCDPMRITKKFTGESCIGKRVFHPAVRNPGNAAAIDKAQAELDALEQRWRRRLEMQQRESAKRAAASAASASVAASGRSHGFITQEMTNPTSACGGIAPAGPVSGTSSVAQTASWLDRASTILNGSGTQSGISLPCADRKFSLTQEQAQALESLPRNEIEKQMKEVERLIHEGPLIQQTSAGLQLALHDQAILDSATPQIPTMITATSGASSPPSDGQKTPPEPADKRMRTGAEDAEALVGFLTAVRASAAAGNDSC